MGKGLLSLKPRDEVLQPSEAYCDRFARHFEDKITPLSSNLYVMVMTGPVEKAVHHVVWFYRSISALQAWQCGQSA